MEGDEAEGSVNATGGVFGCRRGLSRNKALHSKLLSEPRPQHPLGARLSLHGLPEACFRMPDGIAEGSQSSSQVIRKRQVPEPVPVPSLSAFISSAVGSSFNGFSCSADEGVASLLPKMKRMKLRPSLGQLRLQREADEAVDFPSQVRLCMEPEQLRAIVDICSIGFSAPVRLELSFPPQYPHRPPKVVQVAPDDQLPVWEYDGRFLVLQRLTERCWSSAMGVADILQDLLQRLPQPAGSCGQEAFPHRPLGIFSMLDSSGTVHAARAPMLDDVEMA